jgi:hypothetical protein
MRRLIMATMMLAPGLGACAHSHSRQAQERPLYFVPSAAIVQMPGRETRSQPDQVLPASDGEYFIARGERTAFGNTPMAEYSSYSVYTYDAQAIGLPGSGFGYRYRWILQQGYSSVPQ